MPPKPRPPKPRQPTRGGDALPLSCRAWAALLLLTLVPAVVFYTGTKGVRHCITQLGLNKLYKSSNRPCF